ncbi:MAG: radical SAM protein [Polyangiales bacterium]
MSGAPSTRFADGQALLRAISAKRAMPTGVHLQVADRCNHACQHCYQIQGLKGELSLDDVRRVLDDLAAEGVLTVNVSGGEATLRHDLVEILAHARARGFAVRLYTNAFLIDEAYAERLAAIGLYEVHVSVYSAEPSEHDAATRVPGSFARTLAGIRAMRDRGMRVVVKSPATVFSSEGAPAVERLARSLGCEFRASASITPMEDGSLAPLDVAASPEHLVATGLLRPWAPRGDITEERTGFLSTGSCGVGKTGVVVLPNGDVLPCTDTPIRLGNALEEGLSSTLRGDVAEMFRSLTWSDVHGCRDCDLLPACHRCHATALHEGGDYLGPYPSACGHALARYRASTGTLEILSPAADRAPETSPRLGPFKIEGPGLLRPVADVKTAADEALAARHPWLRRAAAPAENAVVPTSRLVRTKRQSDTPTQGAAPAGASRQKFHGV